MTASVLPATTAAGPGPWRPRSHPTPLGTRIPESKPVPELSWRPLSRRPDSEAPSSQHSSQGPSPAKLRQAPRKGQILFLPADSCVPADSVYRRELKESKRSEGQPWTHPILVVSVNEKTATFVQITSIDICERTKSLDWARRYLPINHKGGPTRRHPNDSQPHLNLLHGEQMAKPSSVNVDGVHTIEWAYLSYLSGKTGLFLEEASTDIVDSLIGNVPCSLQSVGSFKRKRQDVSRSRASPPMDQARTKENDKENSAPSSKKLKESPCSLPTPPSSPEPEEPPKPASKTAYVPPHRRGRA